MKSKSLFWLLTTVWLTTATIAEAQQPKKVPRIGYVSGSGDANNPGPQVEAFRQGLRDLGYIEAKNILIEYRYVEGKLDRVPGLVAELRSGRDWDRRQFGAPGRKYHRAHLTDPRVKWKTVGIPYGGASADIARRSSLGCE